MSKATVTRLFLGSTVAVIAGIVLASGAVIAADAGDALILRGPDVTGIKSSGFAWTMVGLAVVGILAVIGGAIAGLVAWIGALLNTAQLPDKAWFVILLLLGIWNLGFVAMAAYLIAGPDGTPASLERPAREVGVGTPA